MAGGKISLSRGSFNLDAQVTVDKDNVYIAGQGRLATIVKARVANINSFVFGNGAVQRFGFGLRDLTIDTTVVKNGGSGILLDYVAYGSIVDFRILSQYYGITLDHLTGLVFIERGDIRETVAANGIAVVIQGNCVEIHLDKIVADNAIVGQALTGIKIAYANGVWITDCDILRHGAGLTLNPGNGQIVQWCFILNSSFDLCNASNIIISAQNGGIAKGNSFTQCWAGSSQSGYGVDCTTAGGGIIDGAHFNALRCYNNWLHGFIALQGQDITLDASFFAGNSQAGAGNNDGVWVNAGVNHFAMRNCRSGQHAQFGNTQRYGCNIAGATNYYIVVHNDLSHNLTGGLNDAGGGANKIVAPNLT